MTVSCGSTGPTGYTSSEISPAVPVVLTPEVVPNVSFVLFAVYSHPCPYRVPGFRNRGNTYTPTSRRYPRGVVVDPVTLDWKYSPYCSAIHGFTMSPFAAPVLVPLPPPADPTSLTASFPLDRFSIFPSIQSPHPS